MIQKLVYSALIVMMSTAAFAARDTKDTTRDAKDDARVLVDAQGQSGAMNLKLDENTKTLVANDQVSSTVNPTAGQVAQKVMLDPSLAALPGVEDFTRKVAANRNAGMGPDEAREAALKSIGKDDQALIDACGK